MNCRLIVCGVLAVIAMAAADKPPVEADWATVRQRLAGHEGRTFHVVLLDGREFRATLVSIEKDALLVTPGQTRIPRASVVALQRQGRRGWGRVIGTLAGAGVMIALVAHPPKRTDTLEEKRYTRGEAAASGSICVGLGLLVGFAIDKPYPQYWPTP